MRNSIVNSGSLVNISAVKSKSFLIPSVLFILFLALCLIALQSGNPKYSVLRRTLIQWDGQHYLSITDGGYAKFACRENRAQICGNTGWFPFYPIVAKAVALSGIPSTWSLIITSWLAFWMALIMLYRLVAERFDDRTAGFSIVALMLFPGSFYFLTGFPYALALLLMTTGLYLLQRKQYLLLIPVAGTLAVTYPTGLLLGLPIAYVLIAGWKKHSRQDKVWLLLSPTAMLLALFLYFGYYWLEFDDFFLYQRIQTQSFYGHQLSFPLYVMVRSLLVLHPSNPVFISLLFVIPITILFYSRKIPVTWQLLMFGILLFTPTFGNTMCYYRHIVLAMPLFVMIGLSATGSGWRRYLFVLYAVAAIYLNWTVFLYYYKVGMLM